MERSGRRLSIYLGEVLSPDRCDAYRRKWCREAGITLREAYDAHPWPGDPPPKEPSLIQKAGRFTKAIVEHVSSGMKKASPEEAAARLSICVANTCGQFIREKGSCAKCGCNMSVKTTWAEQECPIGLWKRFAPILP